MITMIYIEDSDPDNGSSRRVSEVRFSVIVMLGDEYVRWLMCQENISEQPRGSEKLRTGYLWRF